MQVLGHVLMYGAFADPITSGRRTYGRSVFHDVGSENDASFLIRGYVHHTYDQSTSLATYANRPVRGTDFGDFSYDQSMRPFSEISVWATRFHKKEGTSMFDDALPVDTPDLFEGMTVISAVLDPSIAPFNDRRIKTIFIDKSRMDKKAREVAFLRHRAEELGFNMEPVHSEDLDALTSGKTHGGIVAVCSDRTIPALRDSRSMIRRDGFYVFLEGIEDPYNFGYTLRSLYAAGADGVILPQRNWMGVAGLVARSSAGTSEKLPLYISEAAEVIPFFHQLGYRAACAEIRDAVDLYEADLSLPLLLVIGGEKRGISRAVLADTDFNVRIGYSDKTGFRGSLSSAASAAVLAFEVLRQNRT